MRKQLALLLTLIWALMAGPVMSTQVASVDGTAEVRDAGGDVVLTVPVTEAVPWKVRLEDGPPRLIVEFRNLEWGAAPDVQSSSIAEVRIEQQSADWSRLVAYLREPLMIGQAEMSTDTTGAAVLELILTPSTGAAFSAHTGTLGDPSAIQPKDLPVVVIDPGHGGRDPGATTDGLKEADLMLEFALHLQTVLQGTGMFEVVLTREEDIFVPLGARLSKARSSGATVFLSLHADRLAEDSGQASGLTLYTLGRDAADIAAAQTVERNAPTDVLQDVDLSEASDEVALALLALQRQNTDPRTNALSTTLLGALTASGVDVNARPERQGNFAVLKAADFPSVLIELGFLSSDEDLERLTSQDWRDTTSIALRDGLLQWVQEDQVVRDAMRK
jgi:N-acetylmuramoyl-L-alanine amidase